MIEENGRVVEIEGRDAWVETARRSSCGSCSAKGGCGTGALSQVLGAKTQRIRVTNPINAPVGSEVVLGIPERTLLGGAFAVYIFPLLALIGGALLGEALAPQWGVTDSQWPAIVLGAVGFMLGLGWLKRSSRRAATRAHYLPEILRLADSCQPLQREL